MVVATASELGKKGTYRYIEVPCVDCGEMHWVALRRGVPRSERCHRCANREKLVSVDMTMENNPNWRGGRHLQVDGYVQRSLEKSSPYYSMVDNLGRIREHRLIMAEQLGRPLEASECVHHKNDIRSDNHIDNLELLTASEHCLNHHPVAHPIEDGKKQCNKCAKILPIWCFYRSKNKAGKQGYRPQCKSCENKHRRNNYKIRRAVN